jgi:hypothetical protein
VGGVAGGNGQLLADHRLATSIYGSEFRGVTIGE